MKGIKKQYTAEFRNTLVEVYNSYECNFNKNSKFKRQYSVCYNRYIKDGVLNV